MNRSLLTAAVLAMLFAPIPLIVSGCGGDGDSAGDQKFLDMGTAPMGGAFPVVGGALAEVLNNNKGETNWKVQAKGTKGSQENIRRLSDGNMQLALSNSAISYFAVRGESGWTKKHHIRAVTTIAPNVAMFITLEDSGIKTIQDLKGKRVVCGPSGAGFDMFIEPLLEEHGVKMSDFEKLNNTQSGAVDLLADGNADAAFLGGAVPTGAVQQACSSHDVFFIPFDPEARERLVEKYPFFQPVTVPQSAYSDLTGDYDGLNVGSMHLITSADQPEDLIYHITKTIYEHRKDVSHPAAKFINEENAPRYTGTDFHPGAIKFYKEAGIWPGDAKDGESNDSGE